MKFKKKNKSITHNPPFIINHCSYFLVFFFERWNTHIVRIHVQFFFKCRSSFFNLFINWSIVNLQCCVGFRCIAKWFSYIYNWIYILNVYIFFFRFFFHYRLLQGIECSFLCYTIGSCCLFILYIVVCIC